MAGEGGKFYLVVATWHACSVAAWRPRIDSARGVPNPPFLGRCCTTKSLSPSTVICRDMQGPRGEMCMSREKKVRRCPGEGGEVRCTQAEVELCGGTTRRNCIDIKDRAVIHGG